MNCSAPGLYSLVTNEVWKPSVFRPPTLQKRSRPVAKTTLTPMAQPWYPSNANGGCDSTSSGPQSCQKDGPRLLPPPALGQSPTFGSDIEKEFPTVLCSSSVVAPTATCATRRASAFTKAAMEARTYPLDMFMSVSKDAAHTPYGVLCWAVKQYVTCSYLKVPTHLQLSLRDFGGRPAEVDARGLMGTCLKVKSRAKPVRLTHHKVLSILSRLTEAKYDTLLSELKLLPLRQVEDDELSEICKIVFEKAVSEPSYTSLYARLAQDVCKEKKEERDSSVWNEGFQRRFRRTLVKLCEVQFHQPLQLSGDDVVDRTTGTPLDEEEVEMKRSRLKHRLVGNIRFVAELFKVGVLSGRVVTEIVQILVSDYNPDAPTAKEEHVFELFTTLLRLTAAQLKDCEVNLLIRSLGIAKTIELSHPKPRVRFLMMDLGDLNRKNGWVEQEQIQSHVKEPKQLKKVPGPAPAAPASPTTSTPTAKRAEKLGSRLRDMSSRCCADAEVSLRKENGNGTQTPGSTSYGNKVADGCADGGNNKNNNGGVSNAVKTNSNGKHTSRTGIENRSGSDETAKVKPSNGAAVPSSAKQSTNASRRVSHNPYCKLSPANILDLKNGDAKAASGNSNIPYTESPLSPAASSTDLSLSSSSSGHFHNNQGNGGTAMHSGLCSPFLERDKMVNERKMNIEKITMQLMALFRTGDEETTATILHTMGLKNMVMCLTWWLRLATTASGNSDNAQCYGDYSKVAALLSALLSIRNDAYATSTVFSTVLEWLRFDMEKHEYESFPGMFEKIAQMIRQCHLPITDSLPNVEVVREIMHGGMFNVLLRELIINGGITAPVSDLVKSCHPASAEIICHLHDPADDSQMLFVAAQNRFHFLSYLLCVSSMTRIDAQSGFHLRTPLLPPRCNNSQAEWTPLVECLALPSVASDPESLLFVKMWDHATNGDAASLWRNEAIRLALETPAGQNSTTSSLISVMRVVGVLLMGLVTKCMTVGACGTNNGSSGGNASGAHALAETADVHYVVSGILKQHPAPLYQAATVVELVMHHTRALSGTSECPTFDNARLKALKNEFDDWCEAGLVDRPAVLELLRVVDATKDNFNLYPAYHNCVADVPWHVAIRSLGGN
ncbi:Eukaryotic translation initiation factor 4 gamma type 1 [Trypanosoma equiperdum]|uniref:Eukaryotic translation initiation factor 4 gamma type 1 n=1 Tax=Trypanosoma equiperdum TaxID=5694 RepID=A0A1G4IA14_TRYEQ|nr:Eukaryotic translation initiation factor 4 gamma type 1 [Trypanosoma equiperdum]